ncbi:hypothetical protein [Neomoorella thermoacetica]|uniref:hypothetical protein n=1 Tax=Neomoorella thermoacetica TaxID=1525 RepID=UPI0030D2B183
MRPEEKQCGALRERAGEIRPFYYGCGFIEIKQKRVIKTAFLPASDYTAALAGPARVRPAA